MNKQYISFQERLSREFRKYGKYPLVILSFLFLVYLMYTALDRRYIKPHKAKQQVESRIHYVLQGVNFVFDTFEEHEMIESIMQETIIPDYYFTQVYYQLIQNVDANLDFVIFNEALDPIYMSRNMVHKSNYISAYNDLFISRVQELDALQVGSLNIDPISSDLNTMILGRKIHYGDSYGIVVIYLDPQTILPLIQQYFVHDLVLTDWYGYVISTNTMRHSDGLKRFNPNLDSIVSTGGMQYYDHHYSILDDQLIIHTLRVKYSFFEEYGLFVLFIIFTLVLVSVAYNRVSKRVGKAATASIEDLIYAIDRIVQGELGYQSTNTSNDELGYLAEQFNHMSSQLHDLMKRNEDLVELRKNAQIKQLEAQFNPHFLYNSLETIRYLVHDNPKTAVAMILNLTYLLRYSIDATKQEVVFEEDIDYIKRYLDIIKIRLNDRFDYTIHIDEDVLKAYVPRLLVQPLIENSVKHGFQQQDTLSIKVFAFSFHDAIYIGVHDNGGGISDEKLAEIYQMLDKDNNPKNSFGLHNLYQRLKLMYGNKSDMRITTHDSNLHVLVKIPKERENV